MKSGRDIVSDSKILYDDNLILEYVNCIRIVDEPTLKDKSLWWSFIFLKSTANETVFVFFKLKDRISVIRVYLLYFWEK